MVTEESIIEAFYEGIKLQTKNGVFKSKHIKILVDLLTELANRLKTEESCGKQEG